MVLYNGLKFGDSKRSYSWNMLIYYYHMNEWKKLPHDELDKFIAR